MSEPTMPPHRRAPARCARAEGPDAPPHRGAARDGATLAAAAVHRRARADYAPYRLLQALALASLLASAFGACASGARWRVGPFAERPANATVLPLSLSGARASHYRETRGPPPKLEPLARRLWRSAKQVLARWGHSAPQPDARLARVAQALLPLTTRGQPPASTAVTFALSQAGIAEPTPHIFMVRGSVAHIDALNKAFRTRLADMSPHPYARFGSASGTDRNGSPVTMVLLQEDHVSLQPIPRQHERQGLIRIRGAVGPDFSGPRVFVTESSGQVRELPGGNGQQVRARVQCPPQPTKLQVELLAEGPLGPTVLANFPVWCGVAPPRRLAVATSAAPRKAKWDARAAEQEIFSRMNRARRNAGLRPLRWSPKAAKVARRHSSDMQENGFVGHRSPTTGTPTERAQNAGLNTSLLLENVARGNSPAGVHANLMHSPGHRTNILNPKITHTGVGVVAHQLDAQTAELYVTELFIHRAKPLTVGAARGRVFRHLNEQRQARDLPELEADRTLDDVAQQQAEQLRQQQGRNLAPAAALERVAGKFARVIAVSSAVSRLQDLSTRVLREKQIDRVGIGVVQGYHPRLGPNAFYVVVLLGQSQDRS